MFSEAGLGDEGHYELECAGEDIFRLRLQDALYFS